MSLKHSGLLDLGPQRILYAEKQTKPVRNVHYLIKIQGFGMHFLVLTMTY